MFKPKPLEPLTLQIGTLHDVYVSAVLRMLSDHEPFRTYSLAVMIGAVLDQLRHGTNVVGIRAGKLVAYGGWIRVSLQAAEEWRKVVRADMPPPDWVDGDAVISTIIAADDSADLPALIRGISDCCRDTPVYRVRVFPDGRECRRRPILGRNQKRGHG